MKRIPVMQTLAGMAEQNDKRSHMMVALAVGSAMRQMGIEKLEIDVANVVDVATNFTVRINTDEATQVQTYELVRKTPVVIDHE